MWHTWAAVAGLACVGLDIAAPGRGIVVDAGGRVYFTDPGAGVRVIDARGRMAILGGAGARWLALDESGRWAGETPPGFGRASAEGASPAVLTHPSSPCAVDAAGAAYFLSGGELYRQAAGTTAAVLVGGADGRRRLRSVTGLTVGPDGSVYVLSVGPTSRPTRTDDHGIIRVDPGGAVTTVAAHFVPGTGDPPDGLRWGACGGLAVDETGAVYVAGTGSRAVYRLSPDGAVTGVLLADAPWSPTAVAVRAGEVFVLESAHPPARGGAWGPRVRKVDRDGQVTTLARVRRDLK